MRQYRADHFRRGLRIVGLQYAITCLLQVKLDQFLDRRFVFDDQNGRCRGRSHAAGTRCRGRISGMVCVRCRRRAAIACGA